MDDLKIIQQRIKEAHRTSCLRYSVQILLRKTSDSRNKAEVIGIMGWLENIPKCLQSTSLESDDGCRFDIFMNKVCNSLVLTGGMKKRARDVFKIPNPALKRCEDE